MAISKKEASKVADIIVGQVGAKTTDLLSRISKLSEKSKNRSFRKSLRRIRDAALKLDPRGANLVNRPVRRKATK